MKAPPAPEEPTPRPWRLPDVAEYGRVARRRFAVAIGDAESVPAEDALRMVEAAATESARAERHAQDAMKKRSLVCPN